jgi:hypothetical protein
MMEAENSSETFVPSGQTILCHIPEASNLRVGSEVLAVEMNGIILWDMTP